MLEANQVEGGEALAASVSSRFGDVFDWSRIYQIGVVVDSLERATSFFERFGLVESSAPDSRTVVAREIFGSAAKPFAHRTARFRLTDSLEIVAMEPSPEPGPQRSALESKGNHVFHVCFYTDDIRSAVPAMEGLGVPVISWGRFDDGGEYAVFETAEQIGVNLELYQAGNVQR